MDFTPSQQAALAATSQRRLTVVRAGPGSGKTRVFVEAFRRELEKWNSGRQGIAALSFTNVAHAVVSDRLGGTPPAPHFVGTLDSFLLRFVVVPFAKLLGVQPAGVRLIPDALARALELPSIRHGQQVWEAASLFRFDFRGGSENAPELGLRGAFGRVTTLTKATSAKVLAAKERDWAKYGRLTHSDSHFLASRLLKGANGQHIRDLVTRRFPVILVDEFQDTGFFLGRAILELLKTVERGLVVGDPDQAIYQFTGANRRIFDDADECAGQSGVLLSESHRCSRRVAAVATMLSRSQKEVVPRHDAPEGRCFLVVHDDKAPDESAVRRVVQGRLDESVRQELVGLTRRGRHITGAGNVPWTAGTSVARICAVVERLRSGQARHAAQLISREVSQLLWDEDVLTADAISAKGIEPREWKRSTASLLMTIEPIVVGESWNDWLARVKLAIAQLATQLGASGDNLGRVLKRTNDGGDVVRTRAAVAPGAGEAVPSRTIHSAKGEEFEAVILLVGKPHKSNAPCPSDAWWSDDVALEEREVAYVACSRAKSALCLAVHRETYKALVAKRPKFVELCEVIDLAPPVARATTRVKTSRRARPPST